MRSYSEYCSMAKTLDVVGDRWTLLIVRELMLRDACRYTDLRNGLPGIATNLLADRLRELEEAGVVMREDAPPPIATTLFRLTPRGQELQPVVESLTLWGIPLMAEQKPTDAVRSHWLASALRLMLTDRRPAGPPVSLLLDPGDQPIVVELRDGAADARVGSADEVDLRLAGEPRPIMGLLLGLLDLDAATAAGVTWEGDPSVLARFGCDALTA
jgi:DNA-binding HxlR family transcriptional regulator